MTQASTDSPPWPADGGMMGRLIRAHDWRATLGPTASWPAVLRIHVELMLRTPLAMSLLWGPDLVQLYNDRHAAMLGPRHPRALGASNRATWPEVQDFVGPVYARVFGGESVRFSEQRLRIERAGAIEDGWFDLCYVPVYDGGRVAGILATVIDVTERIRASEALRLANQRIGLALDAGAVAGTWYWDVQQDHFTADNRFAHYFSLDPRTLAKGVRLAEVVQAIHPDDEPMVARLIAEAMARGGAYRAEYRVRQLDGGYRWVEANGQVALDGDGRALTFPGVIVDIEERKRRDLRQGALLELGDRLRGCASLSEAAFVSGEILGRTLGASRAGFGRIDPVAGSVEVLQDWRAGAAVASVAGLHQFRRYGSFFDDLARGEVVAIADVETDPRTAPMRAAFAALGLRALLNVPVMNARGLAGLVLAHQDRPRAWTADEIAFAKAVADRSWAEMARSDAAQALGRLNSKLELEVAASTGDRNRLWQLSQDVMLVASFDGSILTVNPAWHAMLGWDEGDLLGSNLFDLLHPDDRAATLAAASELDLSGRMVPQFTNRYRHRDGSYRWLSWNASKSDQLIVAVGRDISADQERAAILRDTEEKLRHSQKMEAVGQLTGGLAHDFNNLLASIGGSLELLGLRIRSGKLDDIERFIGIAQGAVRRAAALTHRLLAFSRRQPLDARATDAGLLVADMTDIVARTIGPGIRLEVECEDGLWPVLVDPHQLENALLNLCINARDAMPDGGRLRIVLRKLVLGPARAEAYELAPGDYVGLCVSDTGTGMSPQVAAKAFDPFFTTKPIGQGTGLGLSMIYGFVRQSGGHVRIDSTPGAGTAVHLILPRHAGRLAPPMAGPHAVPAASPQGTADAAPMPAGAGASVLLVDDEAPLRGLMAEALQAHGHRVLQAADAAGALRILDAGAGLDLLVTDIGLAGGINGRQLAEAARRDRPGLRVLFITGYAEARLVEQGVLDALTQLLVKPFELDTLARRVDQMTRARPPA